MEDTPNSGVYVSHRCCYLRCSAQGLARCWGNLWTLDVGLTRQTNTKTNPQPSAFFSPHLASRFKSWFVRRVFVPFSLHPLRGSLPFPFCLYALLIGVFMIATQPIKRLTLVTLTPLIFTRPGPWYDITFPRTVCLSDRSSRLFCYFNSFASYCWFSLGNKAEDENKFSLKKLRNVSFNISSLINGDVILNVLLLTDCIICCIKKTMTAYDKVWFTWRTTAPCLFYAVI